MLKYSLPALVIGFVLDLLIGDPRWLYHPIWVCCEDDKQQQVKAFVTELNRTLPMYKRISVVE